MTDTELMKLAEEARGNAYAPYSGFRVGAALLASDGRVFTGCNVENAAYPLCTCAERAAFVKAVSEGVRDFSAIAVIGGRGSEGEYCAPCGSCRQIMAELCDADFRVILGAVARTEAHTLGELLPMCFSAHNLNEGE